MRIVIKYSDGATQVVNASKLTKPLAEIVDTISEGYRRFKRCNVKRFYICK